jgi:hypothetical protein
VFYYISRLAESLLVQVLDWLQNIVKQGHNHEEFNELIDWSDFWVTMLSAEGIYLTTVYEDKRLDFNFSELETIKRNSLYFPG